MKSKKTLYILCALFLMITIYEITETYGLFESKNKMIMENGIAKWHILINGTDIKSGEKFIIDKVNIINSSNVLNGKMAPGVSGYFDIEINPSNTDTSILYSVTFDFSEINNFTIEKIEETTSGNLIQTEENTYSKVLTVEEIKNNVINNIRVYIKWENNEENNDTDSQIGLTKDNSINIPVSVSIIQYLGETIEEYSKE